jgi:hypothetical protein
MSTTTSTKPLNTVEGRGSLVWPRFTPGLLLLDEDLTAGVDYTRELSRLLFRNLFGCGVICGLTVEGVEVTGNCLTVTVQPGLALDCLGDPIHVRQSQTLAYRSECGQQLPASVYVMLRRRKYECMPRALACPAETGGDSSAKTRVIDGYEVAVLDHRPDNACGCPEPQVTTAKEATPAGTAPQEQANAAGAVQQRYLSEVPPCYANDVAGKCNCDCCTGCDWVLLAKLTPSSQSPAPAGGAAATNTQQGTIAWIADYSVSRFIRPVLLGELNVQRS